MYGVSQYGMSRFGINSFEQVEGCYNNTKPIISKIKRCNTIYDLSVTEVENMSVSLKFPILVTCYSMGS